MNALQGTPLLLDGISHRYGASLAVNDVTLDVKGGEIIALLGPSGCGKTTLLKVIAGFVAQSQGRVMVGGEAVDHLPPNRRTVGIVFQNYALFPHMTVADNIAYGLAARGAPKAEQAARVSEMLGLVQLAAMAERFPKQLSGGQQQRIALARALAPRPSIILLDEPFAALDKNLRLDMQIEVKRIQRQAGTTTILVTHDQEEALSMADRVAVLNGGRLEQFGTPSEIYDAPRTLFVNTFVGTANVLPGVLVAVSGAQARVKLDIGAEITTRAPFDSLAVGERVVACIRPEQMRFVDTAAAAFAGTVEMGLPLGVMIVHEIGIPNGRTLKVSEPRATGAEPRAPGTQVHLAPSSPEAVTVFRAPAP